MESVPKSEYQEALQAVRHILDKRPVGSRHETRIANLLGFCMLKELPIDDVAYDLQDLIPKGEQLQEWYVDNRITIHRLRSQDKRDYFTDRFDLELDSERFKNSAWMHNMHQASLMMPFNQEVQDADVALKLLYQRAASEQPYKSPNSSLS